MFLQFSKVRFFGFIALVLLVFSLTGLSSADITAVLVNPSGYDAKIVIPDINPNSTDPCVLSDNYDEAACRAAFVLQDYIYKMTGERLIVKKFASGSFHPVEIHIGKTGLAMQSALNLPDLELTGANCECNPDDSCDHEAFFISIRKLAYLKRIFIGSKYNIPVSLVEGSALKYGVYHFLEEYLFVHWYLPGPLGVVHRKGLNFLDVTVENDKVYNPAYWGRTLTWLWNDSEYNKYYTGTTPAINDAEWALLNKGHDHHNARFPFNHDIHKHVCKEVDEYFPSLELGNYQGTFWGDYDPLESPTLENPPFYYYEYDDDDDDYDCEIFPVAWQPRLTYQGVGGDPSTLELVSDYVHKATMDPTLTFPDKQAYSMGIADNNHFDYREIIKHPYLYNDENLPPWLPSERNQFGNPWHYRTVPEDEAGIAGQIWNFHNAVTERWLQLGGTDHDNQWLTALAYNSASWPPFDDYWQGDPWSIHPNLMVLVIGDRSTSFTDEPGYPRPPDWTYRKDLSKDYLIAWADRLADPNGVLAAGDRLWGWNFLMPRYSPYATGESISWMYEDLPAEVNRQNPVIRAYHAEAAPIWAFDGPKYWVVLKLLWDPSLYNDLDTLLDQYYTDMFASAAPYMEEYFTMLETAWQKWPHDMDEELDLNGLYNAATTLNQVVDLGSDPFDTMKYPVDGMINRDSRLYLEVLFEAVHGAKTGQPVYANTLRAKLDAALVEAQKLSDPIYEARVRFFIKGLDAYEPMVKFKRINNLITEPINEEVHCTSPELYDFVINGGQPNVELAPLSDLYLEAVAANEEMFGYNYLSLPRHPDYKENWKGLLRKNLLKDRMCVAHCYYLNPANPDHDPGKAQQLLDAIVIIFELQAGAYPCDC